MKTNLKIAAVLLALLGGASVNAATITQWTFETSIPATSGPIVAEVGVGVASGSHASASAVYSNPVGNGSNESYSSNFWATGDYYQFTTSTVGFSGISVSWDQTGSGTGPTSFTLSYSVDGGVTFLDFANYTTIASSGTNITFADSTTGGSWVATKLATNTAYSYDLSSIVGLNENAAVYFRLVNASATGATAGTNRVDNFTVFTAPSAVPEPSTYAAIAGGIALAGVVIHRRRKAMRA